MRWYFHKLTTGSIVFAATGNSVATGIAVIGAVLPDAIEYPFKGLLRHRTLTHSPYPYLVGIVACWVLSEPQNNLAIRYGAFILWGCLLHVLQDMLSNGGVPLQNPWGERFGLGLYKVYSFDEIKVAVLLIGVSLGVAYLAGAGHGDFWLLEGQRFWLTMLYGTTALKNFF